MKNKPRDAVVIRVPTHPGGPVCNIDQLAQKLPRVFDPNLSDMCDMMIPYLRQ